MQWRPIITAFSALFAAGVLTTSGHGQSSLPPAELASPPDIFQPDTAQFATPKRIRGIAELSPEARIDMANSANPLYFKQQGIAPQTLSETVESVCGEQPREVISHLVEKAVELNGIGAEAEIYQSEVVAIPFCLKVRNDVEVEVKPGDSPSSILVANYGIGGPKTLERFYEINVGVRRGAKTRKFAAGLEVGSTVKVPFASAERLYVPDPASELKLEQIVAEAPRSVQLQLEEVISEQPVFHSGDAEAVVIDDGDGDTIGTIVPTSGGGGNENMTGAPDPVEASTTNSLQNRLDYAPLVEYSTANANAACMGEADEFAQPFNAPLLKERFVLELAQRDRFFAGGAPEPAVVGIIDSGVNKTNDPNFFDDQLFKINFAEFNSANSDGDADGNTHRNDIFGTNFYGMSGIIDPLPKGLQEFHGTKMASLILGGPDLEPNWYGSASKAPVRLKVVNFSSEKMGVRTVDSTKLLDATGYLRDQGSDIINMSLITPENYRPIKEAIDKHQGMLFVVAAGNASTGNGVNLSTIPRFPARYGGRSSGNDHVLTVASHDLLGKLAHFSNYSREFVDILAPGCALRVRGRDGEISKENGTSASTAITSFTAGLIRTLGVVRPFEIKNRILVGTDYDPQFERQAYASGRLNVVKATSVYTDVVELKSGTQPMLFGNLEDRTAMNAYCATPPQAHDSGTLRKILVIPGSNGAPPMIEFWIEVAQKLSRDIVCEARAESGLSFEFKTETGDRIEIAASDVREIIFATRKRID